VTYLRRTDAGARARLRGCRCRSRA
jgi:hypothetical protein